MSTYIARWPNGDFSIVSGKNRLAVENVLDEVGDPGFIELTRLNHAVAVHFKLLDEAPDHPEAMTQCFDFDGFDERSLGDLWTVYPVLHSAFDDCNEDVTTERVKAAMRVEESRIHTEPEISGDPQLAELQKVMGISKRMAENYKRIANEIETEEKQ